MAMFTPPIFFCDCVRIYSSIHLGDNLRVTKQLWTLCKISLSVKFYWLLSLEISCTRLEAFIWICVWNWLIEFFLEFNISRETNCDLLNNMIYSIILFQTNAWKISFKCSIEKVVFINRNHTCILYFALIQYGSSIMFSIVSLDNFKRLPVIVEFLTKVRAFIFNCSGLRSGLNLRNKLGLVIIKVSSSFIPNGVVKFHSLRELIFGFNILLKWIWNIECKL